MFAVEGDRLAVKLLRDRSAGARERLRDQLAMVGRLPLEGLAVARPLEQLRPPHVGYVMELFTGMTSLGSLGRPPRGVESVRTWYFEGGGLRRRLRLLARAAEVLSEIHGRGLVYVDPSPFNIFVSDQTDACEVRLIDTDNLRTATQAGRSLCTPGYGAPEIVRGTGVPSSLSDAHAFAVIAFETLALVHPLMGDTVRDGEPEMEEQALAGHLPWIDDAGDDRNRSSDGIPRDLVLSPRLREDFGLTFGAGLSDPGARPGLSRWAERLHRAADRTVTCPECSGSYFHTRDRCAWCDAPRPGFVLAAVLLWDPDRRKTARQQRPRRAGIRAGDRAQSERKASDRRCTGHLGQRAHRADRTHDPWHVRLEAEAEDRILGGSAHAAATRRENAGVSPRRMAGGSDRSREDRWISQSAARERHGRSMPARRTGFIASYASIGGVGVSDEGLRRDSRPRGDRGPAPCRRGPLSRRSRRGIRGVPVGRRPRRVSAPGG